MDRAVHEEQRNRQFLAATAALIGASPQNELEGMLISQMIAATPRASMPSPGHAA